MSSYGNQQKIFSPNFLQRNKVKRKFFELRYVTYRGNPQYVTYYALIKSFQDFYSNFNFNIITYYDIIALMRYYVVLCM